MIKAAVICNDSKHIKIMLGLDPNNPELLVITPETTDRMRGTRDVYYYALRPVYAREDAHIKHCEWKSINEVELKELLGVK